MADDVRPPSPPLPRELVLSGGGTGGLAMLGALHRLREAGQAPHVAQIGSASGAEERHTSHRLPQGYAYMIE